jgi:PD-(D/E)XK endonuclease
MLTTDQKGAIAETAIAHAATALGIEVYRPIAEGGRFDMIFLLGEELVRVQCKWARRIGDVVIVRCYSCRRAREGLRKRLYTPDEIDAFAAYSIDTGKCYYLPLATIGIRSHIQLRIEPTRNNQKFGVHWAEDFEFAATLGRHQGAIAQLGERRRGTPKVAGSSPAGSTLFPA